MRRLLFCLLFTLTSLTATAAEPARPKVGLVLSGGALAWRIGVLKALEEQGVRIDAIAGTSMGLCRRAVRLGLQCRRAGTPRHHPRLAAGAV